MTKQETIDSLVEHARDARAKGAAINCSVAVAMGVLESGWGQSQLSVECNNLFGIKGNYKGAFKQYPTKEFDHTKGEWVTVEAEFRCYPNYSACFMDFGDIIKRLDWYEDAEQAIDNPQDFLIGILPRWGDDGTVLEPGWATDPKYASKIWSIIDEYGLIPKCEDGGNLALLQVFEGKRRYDFRPIKVTEGTTNEGRRKLMVRIRARDWGTRLREILIGSQEK